MKKYLIIVVVVLAGGLFVSVRSCRKAVDECDRFESDRRALLENVVYFRTKDSLSAAGVERLQLTKRELESRNAELAGTIKDLGVKIRRLESAATNVSRTSVNISAPVRDTVVIVDSVFVPARTFDWRDAWMSVSGTVTDAGVNCSVRSVDTLVQVVHRVPRKFLFFRWGTKAIRQEVVSRNPHTEIVYTEYVELKK